MEKYIDLKNNDNYEILNKPAEIIKNGGIVIFPTETVYGIGTNAFNEEAVRKIYTIKKRPLDKPISLLVSDIEMIKSIAQNITDKEMKIIEHFFPGPLTIILKKKDIIPDIVTAGGDTVGIRMPAGEIARKLVELSGVPIATPSANISGKKSGTNVESIIGDFENKVDYIIDNGDSILGISSTIVKIEDDNLIILREGSIKKEEIEKVINSK